MPEKIFKLPQLIRAHGFEKPMIPTRMKWSQSSLKLFRKCKRKFYWQYIMRLRGKRREGALIMGSGFHESLGAWYRGRRSSMGNVCQRYVDEAVKQLADSHELYSQEAYDKADSQIQTLAGMLIGYADVYESDRNDWIIDRKHIEAEFEIDMGDFTFLGKIDLLAKKNIKQRNPFLVEHKTASNIKASYIDRLPLDTQCRSYIFGSVRGLGVKPDHVLYDVVRKCKLRRKANETHPEYTARIAEDYLARPDFYFYREPLMFSMSDVEAFEFEMMQTHKEYQEIIDGKFGDPLDPRSWAPNDSVCDEYNSVCGFMKLCISGLDKGTALTYDQRAYEPEEEGEE